MLKKILSVILCITVIFCFCGITACKSKTTPTISSGSKNKGDKNDTVNSAPIENEPTAEQETPIPDEEKEEEQNENPETPVVTPPSEPDKTPPSSDNEYFGKLYTRSQLMALDNTANGYGQGTAVNAQNRPTNAINLQNKYGKYDMYFIMPESNDIYLTFDLGYEYEKLTLDILDTLKEKNVKAVFFVTKSYCQNKWFDNRYIIQRIIDEGHIVANHTYNHPHTPQLTLDEMRNDLMMMHDYIKAEFNYEMNLYRPPHGEFSERSIALAQSYGYKSFNWSFAYYDYDTANQPDRTEALNKCVNALHPGAIYLLHAVSKTNAAILGDFIDAATAKGYNFKLLK